MAGTLLFYQEEEDRWKAVGPAHKIRRLNEWDDYETFTPTHHPSINPTV